MSANNGWNGSIIMEDKGAISAPPPLHLACPASDPDETMNAVNDLRRGKTLFGHLSAETAKMTQLACNARVDGTRGAGRFGINERSTSSIN